MPSVRPGVATQDAPNRQAQAFECAMNLYGFYGIGRTAWGESAIPPDPWAKKIPVEANGRDQQGLDHFRARLSSASASARACRFNSVKLIDPTGECSRNTKSQGGKSWRTWRNASRMTRLSALRVTALAANRLAIIIPRRAHAGSGGASRGVVTTNIAPRATRLPFRAETYSEGRCRRAADGSVARMKRCQGGRRVRGRIKAA